MNRLSTAILAIAAVGLLLGQAWLHLFWETPLEGEFEGRFPVKPVAVGLGAWFLFAGLLVIAWRPRWFFSTVVFSSIFPLTLLALSRATTHEALRDQIASLTGSSAIIFTPLILLIGIRLNSKAGGVFLARFALTVSFVTFGLFGIGLTHQLEIPQLGTFIVGLDQPAIWGDAAAALVPWLDESARQMMLQILGGLAILACVGIWFRILIPPAAIILSLLGLAGAASFVVLHLDGDLLLQLHRWAPEAAIHLPLTLVPIGLWLMRYAEQNDDSDGDDSDGEGRPKNLKPRKKLKRVDPSTPGMPKPPLKPTSATAQVSVKAPAAPPRQILPLKEIK